MPYTVALPDGRTVEFPDSVSREEAAAIIRRQLGVGAQPKESTIGSELVRGAKQLASTTRTGIGALATPEESARAGVERSQQIAAEAGEGPSFAALRKAYEERGLLPAAGELLSQIPRAVAGQGAQLAAMAGGAKLGAMAGTAVAPGVGTIAGGILGAGATLLPQFFGANVERQAAEQMGRGEPVDINRGTAAAAAAGQAGIEAAGTALVLGKRVVKGILGVTDDAALTTAKAREELVKAAGRSRLGAAGRGAAVGLAEIPVEVAQAVIERRQAGLDVLSPEALSEYGENAYLAGLVGPTIGAATRVTEPGAARRKLAVEEQAKAAEERAAAAKAEAERKKDPGYALKLDADYQAAVQRMKELQAAVPKRPAKDSLPEEQMAYRQAVDARNAHLKDVLQPLAAEYVPRKAEIAQLKEQQRVAGMTPEDFFLEQLGVKPTTGRAAAEEATSIEEMVSNAPPAPKLSPLDAYVQERVSLAREQTSDTADATDYIAYLMQDPEMARRLVTAQTPIPGVKKSVSNTVLGGLKLQLKAYDEQQRREAEASRPDLYGPGETADTFAPWKQSIEAEERLREEEAMAVAPVRKEEAVISPEREEQIKALETARQRYRAAADTYLKAKGTPDGPRALQQLFAARKEYESFAPAPLVGQAPAPVLSPETEAQLDKALAEVAGEAPASAEELESRIQRLADTRKTAIAKVSENASELAQYEKLTQYMGTPQGLSEVARTPEMAEAAKRRMTPMLEQAQASRNEAIAAAIQEIRLQRDASGLVPLDKSDADLQNEFRAKLNADLQQAKGKAKVDEKKRQEAIAQQLQRINARIRQIEGGDRAGRLLGYASAFRSEPERVGELNNLYKAYRSLSTQQGLTPQAAQLNRTLQNLVDFYTVGGGAAKPRVVAKGPREARRELVLGERAFTGYEPTVEGTEVRYNKPRKMAEYKATPEEQALVEDMRARELAELNEAADQQYTPETSDRVKKQIFDALRQRIDNISAPATQEEVDAAKAQAAPQDQATGDLFAAATERAQAELQTAGERRAAARSEVGRAMAGMRGKSAIMDQAQRLAEKFGKDLGIAPEGTFAAAKTRLTQAQAAKRGAETEFKEKEQEALRAAADDALIAQRNAEATSRAANNTVDAIEARLAAEKETPAVEVRTPPRAMVLLQKIVELQALIGGRGAQVRTSQAPTKYSPAQFVFRRAAAEKTDADVGPVQDALNQAVSAAKQGEGWASDIEQVQAHMATLEKYLSRREAQGRLLPEAELMAKEWYRKLAAHEAALRRPMYGAGQLTPAEIRDYTQRRLELAQAEYDRIQLQIDGLHRQLLDTEVAVAKREVDRITGDINALVSRMERREGADLAGQELSALSAQYKDAVANLEVAQKTFAERKKAESVPFTRKSPGSALEQWMKGAQDRFDVSVQRFKDKQAALERQATAPAATPAITAAERRAEVEKQRSGLSIPELQAQLEGALKAQTKLKKRGSKKQREALAEKIAGLRAQIGRLKGESTFGTEYYAESEQAQAAQDAREEAEAREAGKEETTRAGRRKAAKEIFGVQRTIAETGEVPQATKDANKLDAVIKNNRQAFEMAVEQGFKSTAIRPQKRGKSATPERLMRTPLEGIAYRLRQEIVEKLAAPRTKKQNQELNKLREQLYGLEQAINTAPVTVEERRRTARAIWAKLPKDMRQDTVDKIGGRLPSGGISVSFFDRFADALETTVIRERLGQPISQAPVTTMTKAELAPIQAETEKRVAATMAATEELRTKYYEQKEKELSDKARLKGTIDEATQRQIEKEANEFADRVVQRIKEEEAREATQRMTEPMRGKPSAGEDTRFATGVEVESPDLDADQIKALENNDVAQALALLSTDKSADKVHRAVAQRLAQLLDDTNVEIKDNLTDSEGRPILGQASADGKEIQLDRATGLSQEVLLHEATHAAAERTLLMDEARLTPMQLAAKRELQAIHAMVKKDSDITSTEAKGSLSEFVAEVMSNAKLQQQLAKKPWSLSNMLAGFKSTILRLIGVKDAKTMLTASIKAVDALFMPTSVQTAPVAKTMMPARAAPSMATANRVADSLIAKEKGWVTKLKDNFLGMGFRTQFVDKLAPSEEALKRGGTDPTKALQAMYFLKMYDQRMHFTSQSITEGVPERVEKTRRDGTKEYLIETKPGANIKQIVDILKRKDVVKAAGSADAANKLFTLYLAARRAESKGYDKLNFKVSEADIKAARAEIEADPTLKKAFDEARDIYNQYNRNLLEFSVQTGALSREEANRLLANNDYIPYYRMRDGVAEMVIGGETPIRIGNLKDSPHLKELVGGDEAIFDFLTSSVQNTSMLLDMATKNLATKNLMFELRDVGLATVAKVPKSGKTPEGAVTFKRDGEDHYAVVDTDTIGIDSDLLVKGLAGIPTMFPAFVRVLGVPARLLRRVVVASPVYMARQLFRDSLAAAMTSGADIVPVLGALKQIGKPNVLQGRGITGGQVFTGMPEDVTRMLKDMQAGKLSITNGLSYLEAKAAQVDALTRKAQYDSYLAQGLSEMEATYMALESMNFSKRGLSPGMHMASTLIPFFNAQIQGLDVLYKSFTGQMPLNERLGIRQKLWERGMMLFGLSVAYAMAMQDDETYKNAKPEEKYGNWFVRVPGFEQMVRLPIPFELGYIFKALPEALVNTLSNEQGGEEAMKAFKHIAQQMVPGLSSYFIPQAVKPALEALAFETSLYTGRSIESAKEQEKEPGYRYRDNTTALAREAGELTGFSPIKMEYLIRGYTGGMGMALLAALSAPFGKEGPEAATKRASDLPVVGTLFQPKDASGIIDATYERMKQVNQVKGTYEGLLEDGRQADAEKYLKENVDEMALASVAGSFKQFMGQITEHERQIRASNMTPEKKREALEQARQAKIKLASAARAVVDKKAPQAALA